MRNPTPRRSFLSQISKVFAAVAASKWLLPRAFAQMSTDSSTPVFVYVGCYTTEAREGFGQGINVYRIDPVSGDWAHVQLVADLVNPSFLALDHDRRFLYSAHGDERYATAFAIDAVNGTLKFLNRQDTGGTNGVHVAVDSSNSHLVVSNYASGSVAVLPINANGSLAPRSDLVELPGAHGPHPVQQTSSHPHQNPFGPQGRFLLVPDKGLDEVFVLSLDAATGKLVWADTPSIATEPGAGPRHLDFHPTLPYVYVLNELDSTVAVYDYDSQNGGLSRRQLLSTLPNDFIGTNTTAEIWVHPSGRFLYCSNRGHDSIAAYAIDQVNGSLTILGWTPSGGVRPRYFGLAPSGTHLYACNERSHNIVALRIDPATGMLTATGRRIETGSPVTMVFSAQRL